MTLPPPGSPPAEPSWKPIDARQRRVLGVLIEKAKTTPAGYPMTVNAIITGCNQKNNREPVTAYDDVDVENALAGLRTLGVVSEIDWLGRAAKYKHHVYEWLGVSKIELAVLGELLLRGAQALGELRGRAARMEAIADLAALKPLVEGLLERKLMIEITPPGRGQIVAHNLYPAHELAELRAHFRGHVPSAARADDDEAGSRAPAPTAPRPSASTAPTGAPADGTGALSAELAELRAQVASLAERIRVLETRIEESRG